jgi:prenyltransferase beta subunit
MAYGCHLLKCVIALLDYEQTDHGTGVSSLIETLLADLLPLSTNGRFRIHERSNLTYLHSHCYATEGLLRLRATYPLVEPYIENSASWLAKIQTPSGGFRAWHDGECAHGDCRSDATSQAARIWLLVDPDLYKTNIERALSFLACMQHSSGAIAYSDRIADQNTWCTLFAYQAARWYQEGGANVMHLY